MMMMIMMMMMMMMMMMTSLSVGVFDKKQIYGGALNPGE
jgi:hypothetical protein